jgi:hypothetical protein
MITPGALKAKVVAGSALVLLFGSGIVVGLAWDQTASASPLGEVRTDEESGREGGRRRLIVDNVGLSASQKADVDSLVGFHRHRMSDLDQEFQPRYRAVIAELREEIRQLLTDDQRVRYDVLLAEHDATRAERRRGDSKK